MTFGDCFLPLALIIHLFSKNLREQELQNKLLEALGLQHCPNKEVLKVFEEGCSDLHGS